MADIWTKTLYAKAGDGYINTRIRPVDGWAALRALADAKDTPLGTPVVDGTSANTYAVFARYRANDGTGSPDYTLIRGFFPFDTSVIPSNATIISAVFSAYVTAKQKQANSGSGIDLVRTSQINAFSLTSSDWNRGEQPILLPAGRETPGVFWDIAGGKIYQLGGEDPTAEVTDDIYSFNTESYTIATEGFLLPMGLGQLSDSVIWDSINRYAYIYGGKASEAPSITQTDKIHKVDPDAGTVTELTETLSQALGLVSAVRVNSGKVYLFGGITNGNLATVDTIQVHDPDAGTVTTIAETLPVALCNMASAYDSDNNKIYLYGGFERDGGTTNHGEIYVFDVATETISTLSETLPAPLDSATAFYRDGNVYILGGFVGPGAGTYYDTILRHNISAGTVVAEADTIGMANDDFTAVFDPVSDVGYLLPQLPAGSPPNDVVNQRRIEQIQFAGAVCSTDYVTLSAVNYEVGATRKNIDDVSTGGYVSWTLNSTGLSWIEVGGVTRLGLLIDRDTDNQAPTTDGNSSYIQGYYSEQGDGYKPKLVITYSTPTPEPTPDVEIIPNVDANDKYRLWSTHADWATARNGASLQAMADFILEARFTASFHLGRSFLSYNVPNLSSLSLASAVLRLKCYSKESVESAEPNAIITEGFQSNPLVIGDWTAQTAEITNYGQSSLYDMTAGEWEDIPFNAAGLALIEAAYGGTLDLCLRCQRDVENLAPLAGGNRVIFGTPSEGSNAPLLVLTFPKARSKVLIIP